MPKICLCGREVDCFVAYPPPEGPDDIVPRLGIAGMSAGQLCCSALHYFRTRAAADRCAAEYNAREHVDLRDESGVTLYDFDPADLPDDPYDVEPLRS